jgi:hypothetical protein
MQKKPDRNKCIAKIDKAGALLEKARKTLGEAFCFAEEYSPAQRRINNTKNDVMTAIERIEYIKP